MTTTIKKHQENLWKGLWKFRAYPLAILQCLKSFERNNGLKLQSLDVHTWLRHIYIDLLTVIDAKGSSAKYWHEAGWIGM